jgi:pyruvate-ferredoxin/flavodoxin oxidoreductase
LCSVECPGKGGKKALVMTDVNEQLHEAPLANYIYKETRYKSEFFPTDSIKGTQFLMPYFEVSGACAGCGETPYYRLVSQLFGQDMMIANATGCTSIYCGSTPSTPFVTDKSGKGVAWGNSLFEDNAEYGFGMKIAQEFKAKRLVEVMAENKDSFEPALKAVVEQYLAVKGDRNQEKEIAPKLVEELENQKLLLPRNYWPMPVTSSRNPFGSSVAMVGLMISVMADWIMSSPTT